MTDMRCAVDARNSVDGQPQIAVHRRRGDIYGMARQKPNISGATVGERIREAIDGSGVDRAEIARTMKVRWSTVNEWYQGRATPTSSNLRRLAEVTGVDVDELLGVACGQRPPFAAWDDFLRTEEGKTITEEERRSLQAIPWPRRRAPTVSSYLLALQALRSTRTRKP